MSILNAASQYDLPFPHFLSLCGMFETLVLPVWLVALILLFAAVSAIDRVLVPSVRWFFRRRMERVVARLNARLERPIQPFKLARRHDMIQRLIYDPTVADAIAKHARTEGVPENVAFEAAKRYAREIVPAFSATAYFGFATRAAMLLSRSLFRVRLGYVDQQAIEGIDPDATVIFVMNHRSNMDYVLVTYLAAERSALSYAVGEWARVWPFQGLIRATGAYFIRRKSRNQLYRRVLARYVQMATNAGVAQAFFPEGGLSLDGNLAPAKLGLLSYVINDFDPERGKDVVFIPVGLNYDRVLEDRVLLEAASKEERRFRFRLFDAIGFLFRQIRNALRGRFHRFGGASMCYGRPVSLSEVKDRRAENVGATLMAQMSEAVPVLPVPLIASIMDEQSGPVSRAEIHAMARGLTENLRGKGVCLHLPNDDVAAAVQLGIRILYRRGILVQKEKLFSVNETEREVLRFYASSISQFSRGGISQGN